jgi:hypothetical protein
VLWGLVLGPLMAVLTRPAWRESVLLGHAAAAPAPARETAPEAALQPGP